jgi:hypothetical protein
MRRSTLFLAILSIVSGSASAQPVRQDVVIHIQSNGVASLAGCSIDFFIAAPAPPQPQKGATLCALGGPFGAGMVGVLVPAVPKFAGNSGTIQLDRTFNFNNGTLDTLIVRTVVHASEQIRPATGSINYFEGSWEITGGTGVFAGLQGQGSVTVALGSHNPAVVSPPEYGREELIGWAVR